MIRFLDKEVYVIHDGEMTRSQMLRFFLDNHYEDAIIITDETGKILGSTTYRRVLKYKEEKDVILRKCLIFNEGFWDQAKVFFEEEPDEFILVQDDNGNALGFAYDYKNATTERYVEMVEGILEENPDIPVSFTDWAKKLKLVCIFDMNELAFLCYKMFKRFGLKVCVIGEKWSWFGIEQMEGFFEYPDYEKMNIYADGTGNFKDKYRTDFSIYLQFFFLEEWAIANQRYIQNSYVDCWGRQGAVVCKCIFPKWKDDFTKTKEEMMSLLNDLNSCSYGEVDRQIYGEEESESQKNNTFNVEYDYVEKIKRSFMTHKKRIYIIGACIVGGWICCFDTDSFTTMLGKMVEKDNYEIINISLDDNLFFTMNNILGKLNINSDDIIIFATGSYILNNNDDYCKVLELKNIFDTKDRKSWIIKGNTLHVNKYAHHAISEELYYKFIKKQIELNNNRNNVTKVIQTGDVVLESSHSKEIIEYCIKVRDNKAQGEIGAIVMNCNPFTLGHKYLIEYASLKVDYLYIFVVEEDKSEFSYQDRFNMVKLGTQHLNNVSVVPSGEWVLSYRTLPVYFGKSKHFSEKVNAIEDLMIFGKYVAAELNIKCRFVGEEPIDIVTRQYNEQMKEILSRFNVAVEEIPRKMVGEKYISASIVRELLNNGKTDLLLDYVPITTYDYLMSR